MENPYHIRIVADYIHLNPARSGLVGGKRGSIVSYRQNSLVDYSRGKGPNWLVMDRLTNAFELAKDGRRRRAYVAWLENRAANEGGKVDDLAMGTLRRGWYLGEPTFVDRLRALIKPGRGGKIGRDSTERSHDEVEAERWGERALKLLGMPTDRDGLSALKKGDGRKVLVAALLHGLTSVGNGWFVQRLAMGHPGTLIRLLGGFRKDKKRMKELIVNSHC